MDTFLKIQVFWLQGGVSKLFVCQKMTFYSDPVPAWGVCCPFLPFHSDSAFPFDGGWWEQEKSRCTASAHI